MKQSKLRKRRVWRYAVLYFTMFIIAFALLLGPVFAGSMILDNTKSLFATPGDTMYLFQPTGLNNNNTQNDTLTGTGKPGGASETGASASASATDGSAARIRLF